MAAAVKSQARQTYDDHLDRAIERATRNGIKVLAGGRIKSTGQRFWIVSSASDTAHPHLLFRLATGNLSCDCRAGRADTSSHPLCHHIAAVVKHETVQADRRSRLAEEIEAAESEDREDRTAERARWEYANMGGALLDCYRGW